MKVLLFDYDGVIVDSLDFLFKTFLEVARKRGIEVGSKEEFVKLADSNFFKGLLRKGVSEKNISELIMELRHARFDKEPPKLFPGISEVLEKLSNNNVMKIVTSNHKDIVGKVIDNRWFDEIMDAEMDKSKIKKINSVKAKFPNTEIFYIGDTKGDIIEGKKAKVKTIGVTWGFHGRRISEESPDFIANSPEDLIEIIVGK